jgi:5-methylcytosine-specific restriction endonuclease McrA
VSKKKPRKNCRFCGTPVNNAVKVYCNLYCQQEYQRSEYLRRWKQGEERGCGEYGELSAIVRNYLLINANHACALCGWNEVNSFTGKVPLQVHHIDGDAFNTKEENLQVLCPNCHALTETFGGANRGRGRPNRRR